MSFEKDKLPTVNLIFMVDRAFNSCEFGVFPLGSAPVKLFNMCSSSLIFPGILLCRYDWFHFADEKPEAQRGGVTHRRSHRLYVRELGVRPEGWFFCVPTLLELRRHAVPDWGLWLPVTVISLA